MTPPTTSASTKTPRTDSGSRPEHLPSPSRPQISIDTVVEPYRDHADSDQNDGEMESSDPEGDDRKPPEYQPMYDYLRERSASNPQPVNQTSGSMQAPYRDDPDDFVVTINEPRIPDGVREDELPPPSYEHLCRQNEIELRTFGADYDVDGAAQETEELVKWVVAMLLVGLTVACVGTAFGWGRERGCGWGGGC